jgi:chromosome segregation ATPase
MNLEGIIAIITFFASLIAAIVRIGIRFSSIESRQHNQQNQINAIAQEQGKLEEELSKLQRIVQKLEHLEEDIVEMKEIAEKYQEKTGWSNQSIQEKIGAIEIAIAELRTKIGFLRSNLEFLQQGVNEHVRRHKGEPGSQQ